MSTEACKAFCGFVNNLFLCKPCIMFSSISESESSLSLSLDLSLSLSLSLSVSVSVSVSVSLSLSLLGHACEVLAVITVFSARAPDCGK